MDTILSTFLEFRGYKFAEKRYNIKNFQPSYIRLTEPQNGQEHPSSFFFFCWERGKKINLTTNHNWQTKEQKEYLIELYGLTEQCFRRSKWLLIREHKPGSQLHWVAKMFSGHTTILPCPWNKSSGFPNA